MVPVRNIASLPLSTAALIVLAIWAPKPVTAQAPASAPPHQALQFFAGSWTTAESKPEEEFRETCAWLAAGGRHMVCRAQWKDGKAQREGISIFSYDASSGEYVYNGFRPGGSIVTLRGALTSDGWLFTDGPKAAKVRVTITRSIEGNFTLVSESRSADASWQVDGTVLYKRLAQ